jgi:hypothetical protein
MNVKEERKTPMATGGGGGGNAVVTNTVGVGANGAGIPSTGSGGTAVNTTVSKRMKCLKG